MPGQAAIKAVSKRQINSFFLMETFGLWPEGVKNMLFKYMGVTLHNPKIVMVSVTTKYSFTFLMMEATVRNCMHRVT